MENDVTSNILKIILFGVTPTVFACVLVIWFFKKPPKSKNIFTFISSGWTIVSLTISFTTVGLINSLLSCVCILVTLICAVLERTYKDRKISYKFYDEYNEIQSAYEHICKTLEKKNAPSTKENKLLLDNCVILSLQKIRLNMAKFLSHFIQGQISTENNDTEEKKITMRKRELFFCYNFENAHDYIYLSNHRDANVKIFSNIFFGIYGKVKKNFLAPLYNITNTKVPEFIARELDNAILEIPNVKEQYNTSKYTMKDFYNLYYNERVKKNDTIKIRRIFIYKNDDIEKYITLETENDNIGKSQVIDNFRIPLLLWVIEWHIINTIEVGFVSEEAASCMQQNEGGISTLDFSITHIEQNDTTKYKDIILKLGGEPGIQKFYNLEIKYHSLTADTENYDAIDSEDAEHFKFFNLLWNLTTNGNRIIEEKIMNEKNTWYHSLESNYQDYVNKVLKYLHINEEQEMECNSQ